MNGLQTLVSTGWQDYELLDSGGGVRLERFGAYTVVRPEAQAMWRRALPAKHWDAADAVFHGGEDEEGGGQRWETRRPPPARWTMQYGGVRFRPELTPFRHLGVFPEHACQWDWMGSLVRGAGRPVRVLNLFAYTGVSTLLLAHAGAQVTHVDASKKVVAWARENQALAGLEQAPVRWIIEDALKYTRREARREARYDGIVIDPPKFGRGPQGEVWKLHDSLPELLNACRAVLSERPLFVLLSTYAVRVSSVSLAHLLAEILPVGTLEAGEMGVPERSAGRALFTAGFARWCASPGAQ